MILINDEKQAAMYKKDIEPNLEPGNMLMFAHGFAIHFGQIVPPNDIIFEFFDKMPVLFPHFFAQIFPCQKSLLFQIFFFQIVC